MFFWCETIQSFIDILHSNNVSTKFDAPVLVAWLCHKQVCRRFHENKAFGMVFSPNWIRSWKWSRVWLHQNWSLIDWVDAIWRYIVNRIYNQILREEGDEIVINSSKRSGVFDSTEQWSGGLLSLNLFNDSVCFRKLQVLAKFFPCLPYHRQI